MFPRLGVLHAKFQSLRLRTVGTLAVAFSLFFAVFSLVSNFVLLESFKVLEKQNVRHSMEMVSREIASRIETIDTLVRDWAWWDDAYAFVLAPNEQFIDSNLPDSTFVDLRLNLVAFFSAEGSPVYTSTFDFLENEQKKTPPELLRFFAQHPKSIKHKTNESFVKGICLTPKGPLLFCSRPILTSDVTGPIRGALVFARFLDLTEIEKIGDAAGLHLKAVPVIRRHGEQSKGSMFEMDGELLVEVQSRESIIASLVLHDVHGGRVLRLEANLKRSVYGMGLRAIRTVQVMFLLVGILFCLVVYVSLGRQVISPVHRLTEAVAIIGTDLDADMKVKEEGTSELLILGRAINRMLAALERNTVKLAAQRKALEEKNKEIKATNRELEKEIRERKHLEQTREDLIASLQSALKEVKTLSGFLPICSSCKKIRDDKGYWNQVEKYIGDRSRAQFSHSICPDCAEELYGEILNPEFFDPLR